MELLDKEGACPWTVPLSESSKQWFLRACEKAALKEGIPSYSGRQVKILSGWAIPKKIWKEILSNDFIKLLNQYLGPSASLRGVEIIEVHNEPAQLLHRDHAEGARALLMMGISLKSGCEVGTEFVKFSHKTKPNDEFHFESREPIAGGAESLLFDGYVVHGGCDTRRNNFNHGRVFICFESSLLSESAKDAIRAGHGTRGAKSIPISSLLSK